MLAHARKLALTAHISSSVGWLGAVACFLVLAIAGLLGRDVRSVRAVYLAMEILTSTVIVPLCVASLVTGMVQSMLTKWGLLRHYWVAIKLLLTILATIILVVHTAPIRFMASAAGAETFGISELRGLRLQLIADAAAALGTLLVATTLSVYKPRGLTPWAA
jgi:hypothetical protein